MPLRQLFRLLVLSLCLVAGWDNTARAADHISQPSDPHHLDGSTLGDLIDLSQNWLVYGGDDSRFSDPGFDDSRWQVASLSQHLNRYGIHDQPVVWYRIHVQVSPSAKDLSLDLNRFRGSMEVYVNGVRIGQLGQMRGGGELRQNNFHYVMPIPQSAMNGGNLLVAVRGAIGSESHGETFLGGLQEATLGKSNLLQDEASLHVFRDLSSNGIRLLLQAITIFILIALVIALPRQREYLALVICFAFEAMDNIAHILTDTSFPFIALAPTQTMVEDLLSLGALLAFLEFIDLALGKTSHRWVRWIQVAAVLSTLLDLTWMVMSANGHIHSSPALTFGYTALRFVLSAPFVFVLPGLLIWNWRERRSSDAGLLLILVLLEISIEGYLAIGYVLLLLHVINSLSESVPTMTLGVTWGEVGDVAANLALLLYIILRVVRTVREGARYASEVEAARTVQRVLLARSQQATPGFEVETVYLPANEVGGDFFLVSPGTDGSLLAIIGDVAGKGMLAAMRVSVILGILRREDSRSPGTILARLNDAMMVQGDMGLTTACCVHIEQSGRYVVANAGHISPYVAGREIATAGALPLGIASEQDYVETEGHLEKSQAFVLMSDGVVEARSSARELYGFERLAALTKLPAVEIANTARLFGQEDDITVLSVACIA